MNSQKPLKWSLTHYGHEQHPVIIIDDFAADPDALIADASMLSFRPIGPHYPGIRAPVPAAMVSRFVDSVSDLIAVTFGANVPFTETECCYSIVTTPPENLTPIQRLPHFDSSDPGRIALLHYLSPGEEGGTSFFRHRTTGYESVNAQRQGDYSAAVERELSQFGMPGPAYVSGDTPIFEQIAHYRARFNRAIIYRGNTLHCADIPAGMALPADPATGRLTINTFIHSKTKA